MGVRYWYFAPGRKGCYWNNFYHKGIIAINSEGLKDLREYANKNEIKRRFEKMGRGGEKHNIHADYQFVYEISKGDVIIVKQGQNKIIGIGIVVSDYLCNAEFGDLDSYRQVEWLRKYDTGIPIDKYGFNQQNKVLTDVTGKINKELFDRDFLGDSLLNLNKFVSQDDVIRKKAVEKSAIECAWIYFQKRGYDIEDRQNDNCGYDLIVVKGKEELHVEVKGTVFEEQQFYISKNKHAYVQNNKEVWRLVVVTSALNKPKLTSYKADEVEQKFDLTPLSYKAELKKNKKN